MPSTTDGWSRSLDGSHHVFTAHEFEIPDNDDRQYRLIRLPNQLEALLIHDANTDKASAALDVHVGNLSDPDHLEGLAHFCEHLLFMGTSKYPKENDYFQYCSEHTGHSNAYTDSEHTNFYFEVGADYLQGALDRFAQFFISPLFSESCTERELKAVDSEHKKNLQTDGWRLHELEKSLTNPNHPYSKFGTGNLHTLKYNPEKLGVNIRDELLRFHDTYYSSNIMKLCVLGKESLDELAEWVLDKFQHVPNKNIQPPIFEGHPLTEKELMKQVYVMPVKDYRCLDLTFPFPYQQPYFRIQPGHYLSHLIGHEGAGSILCYLKQKGWANYLSSGPVEGGINFDFFKVSIDLTEDGLAHYEDVVATVFQYIHMLKRTGVQENIFREVQSLARLSFKFRENFSPSQYTSLLVEQMHQNYPREWVISASSLIREYDAGLIQDHLAWLDENAFRLTLTTRNPPKGIELTKREQWYETEYEEMPMQQSIIDAIRMVSPIEELHYPGINEFIPTIFETNRRQIDTKQKKPELIKDTPTIRLWHKKDDTFWVPRTNMWILLRNPSADVSPANSVKTKLYTELLVDSLNVYSYDAEVAGLLYYVDEHSGGILLDIGGYNQKLPLLLRKVLMQMRNFTVEPSRFKLIKEQLIRSYKNFALEPPYQLALFYLSHITHERLWTAEEKLLELESITSQDIQDYYPTLLSDLFIEVLVHGNAFANEAIGMTDMIESILKPRALSPSQLSQPRTLNLPEGSRYVFTSKLMDESNVNSAIEYFIQICEATDIPSRARLSLVAQIMQEPCFDQLRTKEQLGYLVFSGIRKQIANMGLRFIIQSEKDTIYLENRIEEFLDSLKTIIENLSEKEYQAQVNSLIADKLEKDKNLGQEGIRYWSEIQYGTYDFGQVDEDVVELRTISKASLLEFFNTYVHYSSPIVRKISTHIQSQKQPVNIKPKINIESLYVCLNSQGVTKYNLSDLETTVQSCESGAPTEDVLRKLLKDETKANENEIEMLISKLVSILKIDSTGSSGTLVSVTPPTGNGQINPSVATTNRDHTQLPAGNTEIDDFTLRSLKARMN
ncbi:hypothetical protein K450DRAFT_231119 [Umbelopsis ramanniana AG]|uniref:Uncharacterized protein n=1 Tax=Umbelopsis ramanniana AG TaxID=1314678 RepID=A0AAD5HG54_UMBRA|nr:uncharacterized protein K450DRAFT_231119 [Umbelopsis ramanniana AG]KAI8581774.1 hypothetical protein K450DRAFT_231119 [Umbelopsis ramanniana AG]